MAELKRPAQIQEIRRRVKLCERALELIARERDPPLWAALQHELAASLALNPWGPRTEHLERAIQGFEAALEVRTRDVMPVEWAQTQMNLAGAYVMRSRGTRQENSERAIVCFEAALEVLTRKSMPVEWAEVQCSLAVAYRDRIRGERAENLERAIAGFEAALEVFIQEAMPLKCAHTVTELATAYRDRIEGDRAENLERAIEGFEAALEVRTREAMPVEWAETQHNLAIAYCDRLRGDRAENLERAIAGFKAAQAVLTRDEMPSVWAGSQTNLAIAYSKRIRGDRAENLERAIEGFEAALEVRTREEMPVEWAETQHNLAIAYRKRIYGDRAKNVERAIAANKAALDVRMWAATPMEWADTQNNLANAYAERISGNRAENLEHALAGFEAVLKVRTPEATPAGWAQAQMNLAIVYAERIRGDRTSNLERAITGLEAAQTVFTREAMPMEHLRVQLNLGRLLFDDKRWKESCSTFQQAKETQELLYITAATPEARQATLREFPDILPRLAYALARKGGTEDLEEAITVAEQARARAMAETLALEETPLDNVHAEHGRVFEETRRRIQELQAELRLIEGTPAHQDFLTLASELRKAYTQLKKVIAKIRDYKPDFLPETGFEDILKTAASCPLVYLVATEDGGVALLADTTGCVRAVWLPGLAAGKLNEQVLQYYRAYSRRQTDPTAWKEGLDKTLQWLWDAGIGSLISALHGHKEVVLVPGGWSGLLPLHAAWMPCEGASTGRLYALDTVTFRYAPSARAILAAERSAAKTSADALLAVDEPQSTSGSALPNSEREVSSAVSHFKRNRVLRLERATRESLLKELNKYPVLHFSCHGFADFANPLAGGLAMANNETLTLSDFLDARLPGARLAVLSACETGIPGMELPDEVLSLPSGLMQAGVDGVVGSLWSVSDISTMMLMVRFYDLWRDEGLPPHEALRAAQQWLRDTTNEQKSAYFQGALPEFSSTKMATDTADALFKWTSLQAPKARSFQHPFHWAAFCYFGV